MDINLMKQAIDDLLLISEGADTARDAEIYGITHYYRINAERSSTEDKREVVLNVLGSYPNVSLPIALDEISEDYDRVVTRDALFSIKEWAYRYGSKGRPVEQMSCPDTGERIDIIDDAVATLNSTINETELTVNDAALAAELAQIVWNNHDSETSVFESQQYEQVGKILDEFADFITRKQPGLDWDMLGGSCADYENRQQEQLMKTMGKRSVMQELREFDSDSIQEFLEHKD